MGLIVDEIQTKAVGKEIALFGEYVVRFFLSSFRDNQESREKEISTIRRFAS